MGYRSEFNDAEGNSDQGSMCLSKAYIMEPQWYSIRYVLDLAYFGGNEIHQHLEGWNATTGSKLYTFEGHDTPVHSVCPHNKQNVNFFFSTSVNGKIKAWLYNNMGYQVDYDASDHSITTMAYSADGKRLFSCGTSKDGESHVVEWNENDGVIKRNYVGFQKPSSGVVQFDTSKNKYLSVGDDYAIKVWDMDKVNILTAVDAEGGLPLPETWIRKGYHNLFDRIKMGQQS
ncbi:protein TPR3-like isoform X2 [Malus domestica]|uniref:protein TPR3-like isoform X2 n=1 Tax=Malus domestica TaxID=3750 RepID=UPI000499300B